ncbi:MAG: hypothetical protein GX895_09755 [Clostridiales bacterium]|uniref:hypothetical protein n=1 Tax=Clostridium sp. N3C TaxID=1776758 RepID=UPI00092E02A0|nr:hypothetical protein [Clostridium sp. N3C]NLZ49048.1 hypothetical protein [Clostridiales bacterium]SCN26073.1 hypothetical protein N3C_2661 [Clostridium sp. N3C]
MDKQCIFHENKICDDCNQCDLCDLDQNKICDNCGKCLEINSNDYRKVLIEDIYEGDDFEDEDLLIDTEPVETMLFDEDYKFLDIEEDQDLNVEFIEDIEGLKELLEEKENKVLEEYTPGLFVIKDPKKKLR